MVRGGVVKIPDWFASAYTGGKTLGVGFGGYFSIIGNGGGWGTALVATSVPNINNNPDQTGVDYVPLLGYPIGSPDRADRLGYDTLHSYILADIYDGMILSPTD